MTRPLSEFTIRQAAGPRDVNAVLRLLDEATAWLGARGLDQWQDIGPRATKVATDIGVGTVFLVEHGGDVVSTITVDRFADTDFWRHADHVTSALYVHRMAVDRRYAKRGLGAAMLNWAAARTQRWGRSALRLDAWATNTALHGYYKRLGFDHLRTERVAGRGSGALFERPAVVRTAGVPTLQSRLRPMGSGPSRYRRRHGRVRGVVPSRPAAA